jgi:manganese transport protein
VAGSPAVRPGGGPGERRGVTGALRAVGPGAIVAAAFIGPGTVTTATLAGARYGYALLWALAFSVVATLVLQEMSARLGVVTGGGLGEAVRRRFPTGLARVVAGALVLGAVAFGNAAYEAGNLLGAALGAEAVVPGAVRIWVLVAGAFAATLLWVGSYRIVERALVGMVVLMSAAFLATAALSGAPWGELLQGLFVPRLPAAQPGTAGAPGILVVVGLIGTTVVPYNLFLHASAAAERWRGPGAASGAAGGAGAVPAGALRAARLDLALSIGLGGVVSLAIVVTSAAVRSAGVPADAGAMAVQLEPLLGAGARYFFAAGLMAAGLTSAVTAPLAAAYATAGVLGWRRDLRDARLRLVWGAVLATGMSFALAGVRPVPAILFAQVANGLLLPAIAIFLLIAANDRRVLGAHANRWWMNALAIVVVLITVALGARAVLSI